MTDSWPPTLMLARLRGASRLLVEVPPEPRSSSEPKRPLEVTANVVFSRSTLVEKQRGERSGKKMLSLIPVDGEYCGHLDSNVSFCSSKISSF